MAWLVCFGWWLALCLWGVATGSRWAAGGAAGGGVRVLTDTGEIMSEPETCANCRFYRPHPNFVPAGHCHRRAPERGYLDCGAWPSVPPEEWCGEWEAKRPSVPPDDQIRQLIRSSRLSVRARKTIARAEGEGRRLAEVALFAIDDWLRYRQAGYMTARELRDFFAGIRSMPGGEHTEGDACTGG